MKGGEEGGPYRGGKKVCKKKGHFSHNGGSLFFFHQSGHLVGLRERASARGRGRGEWARKQTLPQAHCLGEGWEEKGL